MLILVGPSATGKSVIVKYLVEKYHMEKFVTCTTRIPRVGEVDGIDYHFMSKEAFLNHLANDEFIETVCYNNHFYGTLKKEAGKNKVVILEPEGVKSFYSVLNDLYSVYLNTNEDIRIMRMKGRGDSNDEISRRITSDRIIFNADNLEIIDFILDTSVLSSEELAKIIYEKYQNAQTTKKEIGDINAEII